MNILITGIHGFVGTDLVNALKAYHTIYGLDIVAPQKEGVVKTYTWAELETIPALDVVIHSRERDVEILHWQVKRMIQRTFLYILIAKKQTQWQKNLKYYFIRLIVEI